MESRFVEKLTKHTVRCTICPRMCTVKPGGKGFCGTKENVDGKLISLTYGQLSAFAVDPIEKKPLAHFHPGSMSLSVSSVGCSFTCPWCQNYHISMSNLEQSRTRFMSPEEVVEAAMVQECASVSYTYNEPLITSEWAVSIFKLAKEAGLMTGFVSNGNATPEVLDYLRPVTDCYKVDLKSMRQENYRSLGGQLKHVLWTIETLYEQGFWVEVVTLVVPGFNDSTEELWDTARFVAGVSQDIPWHVTAFHRDYKMLDAENTPLDTLVRATEIGAEAGLRYVYAGNIPGRAKKLENTYCPTCQQLLVSRTGFWVEDYRITPEGRCPNCDAQIPGRWWEMTQPPVGQDRPKGLGRWLR